MKRSNRKLVTGIALIIFFLCLGFNQLSCSAIPGNNTTQVFGKIEAEANNLYLIENWLSRSRVTYLIKGGLAIKIKKYNNSLAIISGTVSDKSAWSKELYTAKIIRLWEINKQTNISGIVEIKDNEVFIKEIFFPFLRKGLYYQVSGELIDAVSRNNGKSIEVKGIITQQDNWSRIVVEVKEITE